MELKNLLKELKLSRYISLDLETTGLDPFSCGITEVSAYRFINGEPVEEFTSLVNPEYRIPQNIVDLTGINSKMVYDKPLIKELLPDLFDFIAHDPVVGQNVGFDISFLEYACKKNSISFPDYNYYDTLTLAKTFLFFLERFNLTYLGEYFGLEIDGAHRASIDTLKTGLVFSNLIIEVASTPKQIIQTITEITDHFNFYNKDLFNNVLEVALLNQKEKGLLKSIIKKTVPKHFYKHCGTNLTNSIPSDIKEWLIDEGEICKNWPSYEKREGQIDLASDIYNSFKDDSILLAEAGTGLGKSLAYLSAGILCSKKRKIPLLVSTYTKSLQEQLFNKDIPKLAHALNLNLQVVIYKGRQNYICLSRLGNLIVNSKNLLSNKDCIEFLAVVVWSQYTQTGDISECNGFKITNASRVWDLLKSEHGYCSSSRCSKYEGCYIGSVRNSLKKADIIIVNHSLLCSELLQENSNLPDRFNYVIDEGHNLVSVARDQLISKISSNSFDDIFSFFSKNTKAHKKEIKALFQFIPEAESFLLDLEILSNSIKKDIRSFFETYTVNKKFELSNSKYNEVKFRYTNSIDEFNNTFPIPQEIIKNIKKYLEKVDLFILNISSKKEKIDKIYYQEMKINFNRLISLYDTFSNALKNNNDNVSWTTLSKNFRGSKASLHTGPRDVGNFLCENLFSKFGSGIICSATLTVEYNFDYFKTQLGLTNFNIEKELKEKIYQSPFYYDEQVKLFAWKSDVDVNSINFIKKIASQINDISSNVHKRMLVLCTSYNQTSALSNYLLPKIKQDNRELFTQSVGKSRKSLLEGYVKYERSILIGTSSFWEGIDLPGDKVEILVLLKVPFSSPADPIIQSQIEYYKTNNLNPFTDFQVPEAAVKLKQGFGRLIRSLEDSGICLLTDPRITKSHYGKSILDSLPLNAEIYEHSSRIVYEAKSFFGDI